MSGGNRRCGRLSYACLWLARIVAIFATVSALGVSLVMFAWGQKWQAAALMLVSVPVHWGIAVALGLAIDYADSD